MKNRIFSLTIALFTLLMFLFSCGTEEGQEPTPTETAPEEKWVLSSDNAASVTLIRSDTAGKELISTFAEFANVLSDAFGTTLSVNTDFVKRGEAVPTDTVEILIGATNRAETVDALSSLGENEFIIAVRGNRLVITGKTDEATIVACGTFLRQYLGYDESTDTCVQNRLSLPLSTELRGNYEPPVTPYVTPDKVLNVINDFQSFTYEAESGLSLPYRLYVPEGYNASFKYPLVLFLHGAGERGTDNVSQLYNAVQNMYNDLSSPMYGAIVVCPQCPASPNQWVDTPWSRGNYSTEKVEISDELTAVMELLDELSVQYPVDEDRVYVMGLSMGGFGTWDLLARFPDYFAAGIPMCGGGDPEMADILSEIPIYTVHGLNDSVVPVAGTQKMIEAIEAAGSDLLRYELLEDMDHGIWDYVTQKKEILDWLFEQSR